MMLWIFSLDRLAEGNDPFDVLLKQMTWQMCAAPLRVRAFRPENLQKQGNTVSYAAQRDHAVATFKGMRETAPQNATRW